jgi:hypothetical protein
MKLNWRGKEYEFINRTLTASKDKTGAGAKVTIDKNIYAFDTESVALPDRYEPICYQVADPRNESYLKYIPPKAKALELFLDDFIRRYSWIELDTHYAFMYAHNLLYDWNQLIKHYPDLLAMSRTGIGFKEDYKIYETDEYSVILRKGGLFTGTAPHFTIQVKFSKREWFDLMFRDTFSFFPVSLGKLTKQLGLVEKLERQEGLGKIDFRDLPDNDPAKIYFEKYANIDAIGTRMTAEKIRELHEHAGMQRIRVSAPGYAINKLYTGIPEGTKIVAGSDDPTIMQLIIDSYAGGRTGGIYHGKIDNLTVVDFHSSYPASMTTLPSFSPTMEYIRHPEPETITLDELNEMLDECHLFIKIDGEETDALYPCLLKSVKGKLVPVYGKFQDITTTGVELAVGLRSGTLKIGKIKELVLLVEMEEPEILPFKVFAEDSYTRKATSEKDSPDYLSSKLELNSSYGKLIESRTETPVDDNVGDIILPYIEGAETDFGHIYYEEYVNTLREDSEKTFEEIYPDLMESIIEQFGEDDLKYANFKKLSLTKLEYGRYVLPAGASLITGTSRARLVAGAKATKAKYWDTDSLFIYKFDKDRLKPELDRASEWLPKFVQPLTIGDGLGEFGIEIENASGYLAGTKRYYLQAFNKDGSPQLDKEGKPIIKEALHGIPTAPYNIAGDMIKALATGSNFKYEGRQRPKGVKETKDANEIGRFFSRKYESQFHLDDRLNWTKTDAGYIGTVKTIFEIEEENKTHERLQAPICKSS